MNNEIRWLLPQDSRGDILAVRHDGFLIGRLIWSTGDMYSVYTYDHNTGCFHQIPGSLLKVETAKSALVAEVSKSSPSEIRPRPLKWLVVAKETGSPSYDGKLHWKWCETKQDIIEFAGTVGGKIVAVSQGVPVNAVITVDISLVDDTN